MPAIYDLGLHLDDGADTGSWRAAGLLQQRCDGTSVMMGLLPVGRARGPTDGSASPCSGVCRRPSWRPASRSMSSLWRQQAMALWPKRRPSCERAADANDFARATYRQVALPRWNEGPVLFIGDAAHGTSPQLGQGANLGLLDAMRLPVPWPRATIWPRRWRALPRGAARKPLLPSGQPSVDASSSSRGASCWPGARLRMGSFVCCRACAASWRRLSPGALRLVLGGPARW
jgi:hypothetical protein